MMVEAIPGVKALLDYFQKERHAHADRKDQALNAIYVAACEAKIHLEKLGNGRRRSRKTEEELARLWSKSAAPVRRFDKDLANRCLLKSEAWISPDRWSDEDITQMRIGIDQVFEDARGLLMNG